MPRKTKKWPPIKKQNRGKFRAAAKRAGMGTIAYARAVLRNPRASKKLKKRAQYAVNATRRRR